MCCKSGRQVWSWAVLHLWEGLHSFPLRVSLSAPNLRNRCIISNHPLWRIWNRDWMVCWNFCFLRLDVRVWVCLGRCGWSDIMYVIKSGDQGWAQMYFSLTEKLIIASGVCWSASEIWVSRLEVGQDTLGDTSRCAMCRRVSRKQQERSFVRSF